MWPEPHTCLVKVCLCGLRVSVEKPNIDCWSLVEPLKKSHKLTHQGSQTLLPTRHHNSNEPAPG